MAQPFLEVEVMLPPNATLLHFFFSHDWLNIDHTVPQYLNQSYSLDKDMIAILLFCSNFTTKLILSPADEKQAKR
jgi:hypothetical protein